MPSNLELLAPGIRNIFNERGFKCYVTEEAGQCKVLVTRGDFSASKLFLWPSTNRDLSIPLFAWRDELGESGK
jgi:hypothetical protein